MAKPPKNPSTTLATLREEARLSMLKLAQDGTLITVPAFLTLWGGTEASLDKAIAENRVFALEVDGVRHVPAFFADPVHDRSSLEEVSRALATFPGPSKLHFFLNPRASLEGKTPLEALAGGLIKKVLVAAQAFAES